MLVGCAHIFSPADPGLATRHLTVDGLSAHLPVHYADAKGTVE